MGVADHHARVDAAGHLLPLPLDGLPLRDLEEVLQVQDPPQRLRLTLIRESVEAGGEEALINDEECIDDIIRPV